MTSGKGLSFCAAQLFISMMLVLTFCGGAHAAELSADTLQKTPQGELKGKFYIKGDKMRTETSVHGTSQVLIVRKDRGVIWVLMPGQMFMEMPIPEGPGALPQDQAQLEKMAKKESLGTEKVNGYECEKCRFTFDNPAYGAVTQWVSKKFQWPVRIESESSHGKVTSEYKNIKKGGVADSLFEVPDGYRKMEMPAGMRPGMQGQLPPRSGTRPQ